MPLHIKVNKIFKLYAQTYKNLKTGDFIRKSI